MKYFTNSKSSFYIEPKEFNKYSDKDILKYAVGANLYMPALQQNLFQKITTNSYGAGSITICVEDSIEESQINNALNNIISLLDALYEFIKSNDTSILPLIFIRVRNIHNFNELSKSLKKEHLSVICGFVFPKFNSDTGNRYFNILKFLSNQYNERLYGMPIIEDEKVMRKESRYYELDKICSILKVYNEYVLNIRIGGTDFSSIFGLRRSVSTTIYDVLVVADCMTDILNYFLNQKYQYVISGPVWEFYSWNRNSKEMKGLIKELLLDIQNGFHGKTVIHPSQIDVVNKAYVIKFEEWQDANNILNAKGGVFSGYNGNRMNEVNPHRSWAKKILAKAEIYGVANLNTKF